MLQRSLPRKTCKCIEEIAARFCSDPCQAMRSPWAEEAWSSHGKRSEVSITLTVLEQWEIKNGNLSNFTQSRLNSALCFLLMMQTESCRKQGVGACGDMPALINQYYMPSFLFVYPSWEQDLKVKICLNWLNHTFWQIITQRVWCWIIIKSYQWCHRQNRYGNSNALPSEVTLVWSTRQQNII